MNLQIREEDLIKHGPQTSHVNIALDHLHEHLSLHQRRFSMVDLPLQGGKHSILRQRA